MVYLVGFLGLLAGFGLGQVLLLFILKDVSNDRLLKDKSLQWKYGLLNWVVAALSCASSVYLFRLWQASQSSPF